MTDQRRSRYTNTIISTSKQRTWLPLFIGLIVGLLGMYFTVSRPMKKRWKKELMMVRRDLNRMASSVQKVAAVGKQAEKTNSLLNSLNDQRVLVEDSSLTLKLIENLTLKLDSQADNLSKSLSTVEELSEIQSRLVAESSRLRETEQAMEKFHSIEARTFESLSNLDQMEQALAHLTKLKSKLITQSRNIAEVEQIAERYINLKDTLTISAQDLPIAEQNLDRWIGMQDRLVEESSTTQKAQNNLTAILDLQSRLAKNSTKTESAVGAAISEIAASLPGMSKKVIEFASLHPVVANLRRLYEPLAKAAKLSSAIQKTGEAQSDSRSTNPAPLVAPRPKKNHQDFFSDWDRFTLDRE